jgi:uncharacterized protein (AIM24 family)
VSFDRHAGRDVPAGVSVEVAFRREGFLTGLWAGEGLIFLQTKVSGSGKVVLTTRGPIEAMELEKGKKVVAKGQSVVARSEGVSMKIRRAARNFMVRFTSGEGIVRVFEGPGRAAQSGSVLALSNHGRTSRWQTATGDHESM